MRRAFLVLSLACLSCRGPVPEPPDRPAQNTWSLSAEPRADLNAVLPVSRFYLSASASAGEARPELFSGTLSDYHRTRIEKDDLPNTLLERAVEAVVVLDPQGVTLAPSVLLEPGEVYSLVLRGERTLFELRVDAASPPLAQRIWPPADRPGGIGFAAYCAESELEVASSSVPLTPGDVPAAILAGPDIGLPENCLSVLPTATSREWLLPPLTSGGVSLSPETLARGEPARIHPLSCDAGEVGFGPGCARVEDDRVVVRGPDAPALFSVARAGQLQWFAPDASASFVVRGLPPASSQLFELRVWDVEGASLESRVHLDTQPAQARLVVNEVLANAIGSEPASEWVELYNDGSLSVDLSGWRLADLGGEIELPPAAIEPGAYGLLVNDSYAVEPDLDVPPAADTQLIRVPQLGTNGLSNSGERVRLLRPDGSIASEFPIVKTKAGVSAARRFPWTLDGDARGFGLHAEPGASPGSANQLAD